MSWFDGIIKILKNPLFILVCGAALTVGLGLSVSRHWACTFDEGFHLTRGVMRAEKGDSRLSYFHPPLQNFLCGLSVSSKFGEDLSLPETPAWQHADLFAYSRDFSLANRALFPEMVRRGRLGTMMFTLLLGLISIWWAYRWRGFVAGWLALGGVVLNPNIITHGNLITSDMGVTALAISGTYLLWEFSRTNRNLCLLGSSICFVLAATAKFTGLIWLIAFVVLCVPLWALVRRKPSLLWFSFLSLILFSVSLVCLYGLVPQEIRGGAGTFIEGKEVVAGRYFEGLIRSGSHALTGQRSYFGGEQFVQSKAWHLPAAILLKTSPVWLICILVSVTALGRCRHSFNIWLPWIPALVFAVLLFFTNQLAIGVRHTLPVVTLLILLSSVWVASLDRAALKGAAAALLLSSAATAASVYPNYISYVAGWAGGVSRGYEWLVDSNYDWGQEAEKLVRAWPELVKRNGGEPPTLLYFGFMDLSAIYGLPVKEGSLLGFMGRTSEYMAGEESYRSWLRAMGEIDGLIVASVSCLNLSPYGVDFQRVTEGVPLGRIGNCYFLFRIDPPIEEDRK